MRITFSAVAVLLCALIGGCQSQTDAPTSSDYRSESAEAANPPYESMLIPMLREYGHRNWIVIADSAYPAQSRAGALFNCPVWPTRTCSKPEASGS